MASMIDTVGKGSGNAPLFRAFGSAAGFRDGSPRLFATAARLIARDRLPSQRQDAIRTACTNRTPICIAT